MFGYLGTRFMTRVAAPYPDTRGTRYLRNALFKVCLGFRRHHRGPKGLMLMYQWKFLFTYNMDECDKGGYEWKLRIKARGEQE